MGKKKEPPRKGPRPPKPGIIQSDPERVRRAEIEAEYWRDFWQWEWQRESSGPLRARRYRNEGRADNVGWPYQGGLPGLGKNN